ncbi:transcriptional regulator [Burkholderia aenigmatica]|uniref:Transcriptional regulator n=1 Tax=Burkholderia aenigmatica TaxID=2015348 RepID=A0A228HYZ8_9BURK|nr:putative DNA binding domain-containing protein [Burkholderia vietnamiensis]MBU9690765.1 putative DNA binding domain-containing protein [Burkholderia multivorans]OXI35386.1 transcriptional regulator [Burkholderia aenigmatica]HDR8952109.1 putative DNA binding domain-containing protein [Burkholderia vietnamiensis]HDR8971275.1 putative DNA binding domain-containing protein [Burkholderia vietnamiensis]
MTKYTTEDLLALGESVDVEFKRAGGRDGKGEVPKEFWPTYSAMANTEGGEILLGVEELKPTGIRPHNLANAAAMRQDIFNLVNNRQKVSANLLRDDDVQTIHIDHCTLLRVRVPRASRKQRPIYVGENPLRGTYERRHEGDFLVDEAKVRQMLAEQSDAPRDATILAHYGIEDLDLETVQAYRQIFASRVPTHPFIAQSLPDFLRAIQAWKKDRESGAEGLTTAGLLMFGKLNSILDAVPNYIVDYQERPEARTEARWIDRLTTDSTWSGNLFDFYRKVLAKLTSDLKMPFRLEGDVVRQGVTPIHEALQEALVNALVHADFSGRVSILVVKRPDMYGFRNPGLMRVPIEQAIRGGDSDCRNRLIQKMFQLVGAGDQAGSGVPRIFGVWKEQSWRMPVVHEKREPEQTLFELRMASLLPVEMVAQLEATHGAKFAELSALEKLIVVTASVEGYVDHKRIREITDEHPADITKTLSKLSREGLLSATGHGRGTVYFDTRQLDELLADAEAEVFAAPAGGLSTRPLAEVFAPERVAPQPPNLDSGGLGASSEGFEPSSEGLISLPTASLDGARLVVLSRYPGGLPGKMKPEALRELILELCAIEALSLRDLAALLDRSPDFIRIQYIRPLVVEGLIVPEFPDRPRHPAQRYRRI